MPNELDDPDKEIFKQSGFLLLSTTKCKRATKKERETKKKRKKGRETERRERQEERERLKLL